MAAFLAPVVRDSSARLLVGYLRSHDLLTVRGVVIDEGSGELSASLVPVPDAPMGGYEASRAAEIARWQGTLGQSVMFAIQREAKIFTLHLTRLAFEAAKVMPALTDAVLKATCGSAFPEDAGLLVETGRYPAAPLTALAPVVAQNLARMPNEKDDPTAMAFALSPLLGALAEELSAAALVIKASSGT
jgi:hypothetical protein